MSESVRGDAYPGPPGTAAPLGNGYGKESEILHASVTKDARRPGSTSAVAGGSSRQAREDSRNLEGVDEDPRGVAKLVLQLHRVDLLRTAVTQ